MSGHIPLAEISYPTDLPLPDKQPYSWDVGLGVMSLKTNGGGLLLRRKWKHLPHFFSFVFHMNTLQMTRFIAFADIVGTDWFNLISISMWTGPDGEVAAAQPVRFIGNISVTSAGYDYFELQVPAELSPDVYANIGDYITGNWVIGGSPASPSSSNWIIAGTPASPSADGYIAGSPGVPSALS